MNEIKINPKELEAHIVRLCKRYNALMEHANDCRNAATNARTESEAHGFIESAYTSEVRAGRIMDRIDGIGNFLSEARNIWITPNFDSETPHIRHKGMTNAYIGYVVFSYNYADFGPDGWHVVQVRTDDESDAE